MRHITTDTYQMKRSILSFAGHISRGTSKSWRKFIADVICGILASGSCILSRFADVLREDILKVNTVERMARKLAEDIPEQAIDNYLTMVKDMVRADGPVYVDDTDVIKPYGKAFEALGTVRDGSSIKKTNEKGYLVTEITALTRQTRQPISVHSHLYNTETQGGGRGGSRRSRCAAFVYVLDRSFRCAFGTHAKIKRQASIRIEASGWLKT